jgi:hypothetical protein
MGGECLMLIVSCPLFLSGLNGLLVTAGFGLVTGIWMVGLV